MDQPPTGIDFSDVDVLTFDCYGTLIDWETGILNALRHALPTDVADDETLLVEYAAQEAALQAEAWLSYHEILGRSMTAVCRLNGHEPSGAQVERFGGSVAEWPEFPDSADALARLARRYSLGVITNCDDDLFAASNAKLGNPFTWVITAQQVGSYKPDPRNFEVAFERIPHPRERIVHVAQSLYHDHVPAKALGLRTVWVNRRHDRAGAGATPQASATPDLTVPDMATFAASALR